MNSKLKKGLIFGAALIALIVLALRFFVEPPPPAVSIPPSVQLLESRLVGRKDGVRQWEILAQSVLQAGDSVTLTNLDEMVMFQNQEPYLNIDAETAVWNRKQDVLYLYEAIVRDNGEDGLYLESDLLVWEGAEETLNSPGPVFILWQGLEIRAAEMLLESQARLLYLRDDVQIRDGSMLWRMDRAVYDLDAELMDFYGNLLLEGEAGQSESE